jgi:septal ring factor EnvC (AmiA/AmiB activator)
VVILHGQQHIGQLKNSSMYDNAYCFIQQETAKNQFVTSFFTYVSEIFTAFFSRKLTPLIFMLLVLGFSNQLAAQQNKQTQTTQQLSEIKQAIANQQSKIDQANKTLSQLYAELKQNDLAIADVAKKLQKTNQQLAETQQNIRSLQQQQTELEQKKKQQESLLGEQLRAAYSNGQHDYIKLLLNQKNPTSIQRTLTYYQYLSDARIKQIEQFKSTIDALEKIEQEKRVEQQNLTAFEQTQQAQQQQLKQSKSNREETLASLNKTLLSDKQKLAKLKAEEENLVKTLQQLAAAAQAEIELTGLEKLKHKLSWPTKGHLARRFGNKKQGYLRWKGVLIAAPVGRTVNAIQSGKVLFADWLNGYGLVTVVDHGAGYMSLYGYNQTLLKNVGERVETGEPIALVGQSGGQNSSGLYFEIRYNGKAMNPKLWCQ